MNTYANMIFEDAIRERDERIKELERDVADKNERIDRLEAMLKEYRKNEQLIY